MDSKNGFFLGRVFDPKTGKTTSQDLVYEPADLTTHALVVGMTGSGKTGLCLDLLEEAALTGIPALMVDPKGDVANALLHFPDLAAQDFQPWVNADEARRAGQTVEQAAAEAAHNWKEGLAQWGIGSYRIQTLQESVQFNVFTPGSDAGIPVSILASLKSPGLDWNENRELLREKISATVTALLGLVGFRDVDPVRSREHILLSNLFEHAWSQGLDLDLGELILQTQNPPFPKLGVFDVNTFFPEKDRFSLAMQLNNILAAPAFQVWLEGQPLDIPGLLYTLEGKPRHSIFYIAHLTDEERMFFVTLLFSAVEAWMRTQSGTSSLRSLVYFDEIFGYLPPTQNPPSKQPILRMLKQARAFGVGLVLVTQNPVDVDYKALSNAGTWMIGKLQTDQDKQRLLDGLQGAAPGIDRQSYDRMLSTLGKRVFLLHNVHSKGPQLFQTRWAMNFLAGPMTRSQIPALNELAGSGQSVQPGPAAQPVKVVPEPSPAGEQPAETPQPVRQKVMEPVGSLSRPGVPGGVNEYFLPTNLSLPEAFQVAGQVFSTECESQGLIYRPALLAQANIRFLNRAYDLDYLLTQTVLTTTPDRRGMVRWEEFSYSSVEAAELGNQPDPQARFASLEAPLSDVKLVAAMEKDFLDWAYRKSNVTVRANEELKVYAGPGVSDADFRRRCSETAQGGREAELKKVVGTFEKKIDSLQEKIKREERELDQDEAELSQRKMEEYSKHAENILGVFTRRRTNISSSMSKRRMAEKAAEEVKESRKAIADYKLQIEELEKEKEQAIQEVNDRWSEIASRSDDITITPAKKDVLVEAFGVAWLPYYLISIGKEMMELPAFGPGK